MVLLLAVSIVFYINAGFMVMCNALCVVLKRDSTDQVVISIGTLSTQIFIVCYTLGISMPCSTNKTEWSIYYTINLSQAEMNYCQSARDMREHGRQVRRRPVIWLANWNGLWVRIELKLTVRIITITTIIVNAFKYNKNLILCEYKVMVDQLLFHILRGQFR